jgi:hypothetical protein
MCWGTCQAPGAILSNDIRPAPQTITPHGGRENTTSTLAGPPLDGPFRSPRPWDNPWQTNQALISIQRRDIWSVQLSYPTPNLWLGTSCQECGVVWILIRESAGEMGDSLEPEK